MITKFREDINLLVNRHPWLLWLICSLLSAVLCWPFLNDRLGPDACNYLDIGVHLAEGKGYTTSILTWFAEYSPIVHSALIEKQPLYPLFLAVFIYFFGLYRIVLLKLFLFCFYLGSLFLVFTWVRKKEGIKPAFFATLYLATSPIMNFVHLSALNYSLFIFLLTLSAFIYLLTEKKTGALLLGLVTGLCYLTRLEGMLIFIFYGFVIFIRKKWQQLIYFVLAFALVISPLLIARQIEYGDFSKSIHSFQYRTLYSASEVMWFYELELKTFEELFTKHRSHILKFIRNNVKTYTKLVFGPEGLFWFFILLIFLRPKYFHSPRINHFFLLVLVWYLSLILRWPMTHRYDRSFLTAPIVFVLVPLYVIFLENFFSTKLHKFLGEKVKLLMPLIIVSTIILNQVYARPFALSFQKRYQNKEVNEKNLMSWIEKNIPPQAAVSSENYYLINYFTRRPTVNLPWNISPYNVDRFLRDYPVKAIIYNEDFNSEVNIRRTADIKRWRRFTIPNTTYQAIIPPFRFDKNPIKMKSP